MGQSREQGVILVALAVIFWGSASPAVRYLVLQGLDPYVVSFLRILFTFLFAALFLLGQGERPCLSDLKRDFWPLLAMAFTGVAAFYWFMCTGLQYTQAGKSTLINAIDPSLILLIAHVAFKEKLGRRQVVGMIAACCGVILSVAGAADFDIRSFHFVSGDLMFVGTACCWSVYATINRIWGRRLSYRQTLFWIFLLACLLYLPVLLPRLPLLAGISGGQWLLLLYMGLLPGAAGFYIWNRQVQELGMGVCGIINSFLPISAVLISALWLKETLTPLQITGAALVAAGVWQGVNKTHKVNDKPCKLWYTHKI